MPNTETTNELALRRSKRARVNPYVDLVHTKPSQLLPCENRTLSKSETELLNSNVAKYQRVFVEIGSGCGGHLIESAAADPAALFIGFELRFKRAYRTVEKAEKRAIKNLLVVKTNAASVPSLFSKKSLAGIFILFPDPWSDKIRWHKKRLLKPDYLRSLNELLEPSSGFLRYKTDHEQCFRETVANIRAISEYQVTHYSENFEVDKLISSDLSKQPASEFELLFRSQNLPIYLCQANSLR